MHTFLVKFSYPQPPLLSDIYTTMDPMQAALADLRSSDPPNISATATAYNVKRSTLSRRFNEKTVSVEESLENKRLLNNYQEQKLIDYVSRQCKMCLPPTARIVSNIASEMAGSQVGVNWTSRFVDRHKDVLDSRFLNTLDLARHKSESRASFEAYFDVVHRKIEEYGITVDNMYNMDEKGFMIGQIQRSHRIFTRDTYQDKNLIKAGQDGNREWITCLATICADGSVLSPALIYKAKSGNVQDTWLDGFDSKQHSCLFSASPNGWTSDTHGLAWLDQVFDKETRAKARRSWRLLFIDGHGSHLTMKFIERCEELRILLAIYPPHSTHKLQPLDVSCFRPLAHYYSDGLDKLIRQTAGFSAIKKRDFFAIFWQAWQQTFKKTTIDSAWQKTGIHPFNPLVVLNTLQVIPVQQDAPHEHGRLTGTSLAKVFASPSKAKAFHRSMAIITKKIDPDSAKIIDGVYNLFRQTNAQLTFYQRAIKDMSAALDRERAQKKRRKRPLEQLRADTEAGYLFLSPSKVKMIHDSYTAKEQEKEQLKVDKQIQKGVVAQRKLDKQAEAERKRKERAVAAERRAEEAAKKKADKEAARLAKEAQREAAVAAKASKKVLLAPLKDLTPPKVPVVIVAEPKACEQAEPAKTRRGRIIKKPAHFGA